MIQAIIFDLDDTLYPERAFAFSGFAAVAQTFRDQLGDPAQSKSQMQELFDTEHRPRLFNALLASRGVAEEHELVPKMIETYRSHRPSIALHPDADDALARFGKHYKLGIISDGPGVTQWNKVDALHLRDRIDRIIITSELGEDCGKPNPMAFVQMSECLGTEHSACTYVADNPAKDFVAPNALGWLTVRILRSDGIYRQVPPADTGKPRHTIDTLKHLDRLLG